MNLAHIDIQRVIVHEVIKPSQSAERPPIFSTTLVALDAPGKTLVAKRLVDTVSTGSGSVDVDVDDDSQGSTFDNTTRMMDQTDAVFIEISTTLAKALADAQTAGSIKSGVALFVQGECRVDGNQARFMAIIKADADQALVRRATAEGIDLSFVGETFLGAAQRLIKIAFFFERIAPEKERERRIPAEFNIKVFDHLMQAPGGDAAVYFYDTFLGCRISQDAARKTKNFYDIAREFIQSMEIPPEEKLEKYADLGSYMRNNQRTINPKTFAADHLSDDERDPFINLCRNQRLSSAFTKDTSLVKSRLTQLKMRFSSSVTISAPQEKWRESIKVMGTVDGWTTIMILGEIEG
ncbi:MAG: hypothetical protein JWP89_2687 [Schlesneria sp.]|nr:hypothetical protein [Schlesneria sp.]